MEVQQAHWERTVASGQGPAYRIHTQRLVLRCWQPTDAPLLKAAIDANLEHLRPWMPWAQYEPEDLPAKIERLRRWRGEFDLGQDFAYGLFNHAESILYRIGARTASACSGRHTGSLPSSG